MECAVFLECRLSDENFGSSDELNALGGLKNELVERLGGSATGEFDGTDVGGGIFTMYMYGPDPDKLLEAIRPCLVRFPWRGRVVARKRYGPPGAREVSVAIASLAE